MEKSGFQEHLKLSYETYIFVHFLFLIINLYF